MTWHISGGLPAQPRGRHPDNFRFVTLWLQNRARLSTTCIRLRVATTCGDYVWRLRVGTTCGDYVCEQPLHRTLDRPASPTHFNGYAYPTRFKRSDSNLPQQVRSTRTVDEWDALSSLPALVAVLVNRPPSSESPPGANPATAHCGRRRENSRNSRLGHAPEIRIPVSLT